VSDSVGKVAPVAIEEEMKESYVWYAMSVIVSRALPDVRDGLKPSQRRILYAMHQMNLGPTAQHRKSAGIVGQTMQNFHPHGDEAIYPTLVRMAQPWNLRYPLVDPHGNFGSVDGDPPGAMRYTEARLSQVGAEMQADIDKNTVDFVPNFDGREMEPVLLPGRFPNLLCNGSSGIAVAMATEMPPHNLNEVADACALLIDNPDAELKQVMKVLPGPDFPTAGIILGTKGIKDAYSTGKGHITMQARSVIEPIEGGKSAIIVTQLPYQVNKANLVEGIANLVRDKKIESISAIRDETDRTGMRIVIELKRDANPHQVLASLHKHTAMRTTCNVIMLALVGGVPRTLTLLDLLRHQVESRKEVITRRARFELKRAQERAHILEGYRIALRHLDAVIQLIKESRTPQEAREALMTRYKLSERQAQAILELMLQRLTGMEQKKVQEEYQQIIQQIAELEDILANPRRVLALIKEELKDLKKRFGDERRTRIHMEEAEEIAVEDLIAEEDMIITVTRDGYAKRLPVDTYRTQGRGGKGVIGLTPKEQDSVEHLFVASTHHTILFFTNKGRVHRLRAFEVPAASRQARGMAIVNLIHIEPGEQVTATRTVRGFSDKQFLVMGTKQGMVKKTQLSAYETRMKGGIFAINLRKGDELKWVKVTDGKQDLMMATRRGMAIRFREKEARPMGRVATGVRAIRLRKGDEVVAMEVVQKGADLLVGSENGFGKRTPLNEYRPQARAGIGLKTMNVTTKTGPVVDMKVVRDDDDVLVITTGGQMIRQPVAQIRRTGRAAQGVRLIRLEEKDKFAALARVVRHEEEEADAAAPLRNP
jgi:DNA gyrase subunit A